MEYKTITPQTAKEMIDHEKVTIVDVREEEEYAAMHIPGSILLPLGTITQTAAASLKDPNEKILVYCRSGKEVRQHVNSSKRWAIRMCITLAGF